MQEINVKMGEMKLTSNAGVVLETLSLGSCIGLAVYDRKSRMAGMAHIVLPDSRIALNPDYDEKPGKYADTAVPKLLSKMISLGSKKENLIIKIAGGAQMFNLKDNDNIMNIGSKNITAVNKAMDEMGFIINKADTGGNKGRTLKLNVSDGTFYLKLIGQKEVEF